MEFNFYICFEYLFNQYSSDYEVIFWFYFNQYL
jgi:hypothetical protein